MRFNHRVDFSFDRQLLETYVGGVSALDISRVNVKEIEQAHAFMSSYGYDWEDEDDQTRIWSIHRRAVTLIQEQLLEDDEELPEVLSDQNQLRDIGYLLVYANGAQSHMQKSACAILRVMHVIVHLRNDLSRTYLEEIQSQIMKPIVDCVSTDPTLGGTFLKGKTGESIKLHRFDIKPVKTSDSSIIKLLAKPNLVALNLLDTIGFRFVTRSLFDAFRVVRLLIKNNLVSFPHVIPDQSANTLYPLNIFFEVAKELENRSGELDSAEIEEVLKNRLLEAEKRAEYQEKENLFSARDYRFIKFIHRRRIKIEKGEKSQLQFFYPYEIQIMDYETHIKSISGPAAHDKYKNRQRKAARRRIFGLGGLNG